jgi:hypothetical protein
MAGPGETLESMPTPFHSPMCVREAENVEGNFKKSLIQSVGYIIQIFKYRYVKRIKCDLKLHQRFWKMNSKIVFDPFSIGYLPW